MALQMSCLSAAWGLATLSTLQSSSTERLSVTPAAGGKGRRKTMHYVAFAPLDLVLYITIPGDKELSGVCRQFINQNIKGPTGGCVTAKLVVTT